MKIISNILISVLCVLSLLCGCNKHEGSYSFKMPTSKEKADIYVEKVEGISNDFIKGVDLSTIISQEESGVIYYNKEGQKQDVFKTLADAGVNYIRVRVWNDPYHSLTLQGYGGGNVDAQKASLIGKRAAMYNMKLLVDFHYSDFWADPSNQKAPKSWQKFTITQKEEAIYNYTLDSLETIYNNGSKIGIVQIGNEINNGLAGETSNANVMNLLKEASRAVKEFAMSVDEEIKVAVHYTDVNNKSLILEKAQLLENHNVDYDIFGVSYYNYWHGTLTNLSDVLLIIKNLYDKDTIVMETAYLSTISDSDNFGNMVSEEHLIEGYGATYLSQAHVVRDVIEATVKGQGIGVFYWEPAWIAVGDNYHQNYPIWEEFGSGCCTSASSEFYNETVIGGGSAWDNQAMFDENGYPLPSLDVFKYVNHGTTCEEKIDYVQDTTFISIVNNPLILPSTVYVIFANRNESKQMSVTWNDEDVVKIDTSKIGEYFIEGIVDNYYFILKVIIENEQSNLSFKAG